MVDSRTAARPVAVAGAVVAALLTAAAPSATAAPRPADPGPATSSPATSSPATSNPAVPAAAPAVPPIAWGRCAGDELRRAGAVCGRIAVPLDHGRPGGTKITLALSMVRHTVPARDYQGIMLVNPGGPGGSGLELSTLGKQVPHDVGAAYDWIGLDPRGVGASRPALSCVKDYFAGPRPPYEPSTQALERAWLDRTRAYATACGRTGGALLDHMRTEDVARDLELVRAATRAPQLTFYGYSYGTYLGQVYATLFPGKVRRMVLDSNVDPTRVFYRGNLDQNRAFQRNLEIFWGWVARNDATYRLGTTGAAVRTAWTADRDRLARAPAGRRIGGDEWTDIFLSAGYTQASWPELARLWADWRRTGAAGPLIEEYAASTSLTDDNEYAAYNAVQCTDAPWPRDWATWREDSERSDAEAPFAAWGNTWFNAPCLDWPAPGGPAVEVDGRAAPPILLIGGTLDAPTPFGGSIEVRRRFPRASLVALPGGTDHAVSLSGDTCLDDLVAGYLGTGRLPERRAGDGPDATCDPLPAPEPVAEGATAPTGAGR